MKIEDIHYPLTSSNTTTEPQTGQYLISDYDEEVEFMEQNKFRIILFSHPKIMEYLRWIFYNFNFNLLDRVRREFRVTFGDSINPKVLEIRRTFYLKETISNAFFNVYFDCHYNQLTKEFSVGLNNNCRYEANYNSSHKANKFIYRFLLTDYEVMYVQFLYEILGG